MTDLRQAAQQALDAWDDPLKDLKDLCVAMDGIRAALEQQQAEPTTPPQRKPLTDERILHFVNTHVGGPSPSYPLDNSDWINFTRAIESAHNIKEAV